MSRRFWLLFSLTLSVTLLQSARQVEAGWFVPHERPSSRDEEGGMEDGQSVWRESDASASYDDTIATAHSARIRPPVPLPELPVLPLETQEGSVAPFVYAQVVQDNTPVYRHPAEAAYGLPPKRRLGVGFVWVSVEGKTSFEGRDYYRINADEYVPAGALSIYRPSTFQGVALGAHPERPFAWILRTVQPLLTPGGSANTNAPVYERYQLVQIYATEHIGDQVWYLINSDQWINQIYVGKVEPTVLPAGVPPGAAWIDVNLFEQTLAAYIGERMVYATLVSSGLRGWNTPAGLFQVWHKVDAGKMSGAHEKPDFYFLEDVPWTLYFNQAVALHGAYWHDSFGYRHSHGCVNLAPQDAKWIFEWAPESIWVRVHTGQEAVAN